MMNEAFAVLGIGICILLFLLLLLGIGSTAGVAWESISQGVAAFVALILVFCIGAFVLWRVMER